jgi:hypothetical protein
MLGRVRSCPLRLYVVVSEVNNSPSESDVRRKSFPQSDKVVYTGPTLMGARG